MAILLLPVCFLSIFFILQSKAYFTKSIKENLLITVFIFSTILVGITEIFSYFNKLNYTSLLVSWGGISLISLVYLYFNKKEITNIGLTFNSKFSRLKTSLSPVEKYMLGFAAVLLLLIFIQGIVYPPNNWDSMTYHLARIASWISHQNTSHYPTHIFRQLYQPPFAEYVMMHFGILSKSDYFLSTVQFLFLLFSLISILLITEALKLGKSYKIIAVILTVTVPEVILQASSTQNDVVISFFVISSFYFILKSVQQPGVKSFFILGLIIGLGLFTKGTSYLYFAPILLVWGLLILRRVYLPRNYRHLVYAALTVMLTLSINSPFYYRNYKLSHNILGVDKAESAGYANQQMSAALFLSNTVKNAGLHMGLKHVHWVSASANKLIYKLHALAGININNPKLNFANSQYNTNDLPSDEDFAPNLFHLLLIIVSCIALFKHKVNTQSKMLMIVIALQVALFCVYLKWQPWGTRLHTPMFLLSVPLICYALFLSHTLYRISKIWLLLMMIYSVIIVISNRQRPYNHHLLENRFAKFFVTNDAIETDYTQIKAIVSKDHYKSVGLITGQDTWIYPVFCDCFNTLTKPVYINVTNISKKASPAFSNHLDCIVTTAINKKYIEYKGSYYYNRTSHNTKLFIYVKTAHLQASTHAAH